MHSSRENLWMLFSSINERLLLAFRKIFYFVSNFQDFLAVDELFNTVITFGMKRIYDVLNYSTIINIFFPTSMDWFVMMPWMNVANKYRIVDFVFIWEKTGKKKPVLRHI